MRGPAVNADESSAYRPAGYGARERPDPFGKGFEGVVPNLRRLGLLTPRVREAYRALDLLRFEGMRDSVEEPEVTPPQELVQRGAVAVTEDGPWVLTKV